ncbi:EboA domain-containing protein [Aquipuribacter sp. SD81]|uniref:EboA domain-containing protein n=1 Tax=Aquipuribacter sp. SD81 TaxID=3127703 RepID=UPI00301836A1
MSAWGVADWDAGPARWADALQSRLAPEARQRWQGVRDRAAAGTPLDVVLPGVSRAVGRERLDPDDDGAFAGGVDDLARALLLTEGPVPAQDVATLRSLYDVGDAAERRAVLRALPHVAARAAAGGDRDPAATVLVEDALRANDTRLVAAAVGAADLLDADGFRQAVLKCLFVEVPLECVQGLARRADGPLAAMTARFVAERVAAGRAVPDDVVLVLPPSSAAVAEARLDDPAHDAHDDRRAAAAAARRLLGVPGRPAPHAPAEET